MPGEVWNELLVIRNCFRTLSVSQEDDSEAHLAHFKTEEEYDNLLSFQGWSFLAMLHMLAACCTVLHTTPL